MNPNSNTLAEINQKATHALFQTLEVVDVRSFLINLRSVQATIQKKGNNG